MNRISTTILTMALAGAALQAQAQDANPISKNMKESWANIKALLVKMADKMPDENYRFKPVPEVADFGQRMGHEINFNMRGCSIVRGQPKNLTVSAAPTKAEIAGLMKQANDECDAVFNSLTDAELLKTVDTGRGGPRLKLAVLQGLVLEHSQEMYGYMAVYLRLKGIVPPSSDRNER